MSPTTLTKAARSSAANHDPELLDLVDRARIGDLDAQSALVRRYTHRLNGFVRPIISDASAVEDVVQTAFIKMTRRFKLLRSSEAFESWLFRLARNAAYDYIRRRRCRPVATDGEAQLERAIDPSCESRVGEILEAFDLALRRLTPVDQSLLRLIVEGHSYHVAAEQTGLSVGAVKVRLCRVRPFLRCSVGDQTGVREPETAVFAAPRRRVAA